MDSVSSSDILKVSSSETTDDTKALRLCVCGVFLMEASMEALDEAMEDEGRAAARKIIASSR